MFVQRYRPYRTIALIAMSLTATGVGAANLEAPVVESTTVGELLLGPVEGITTGWHVAPDHFSVPLGAVLSFRQPAEETVTVSWLGAEEQVRDISGSTADCPLFELGTQTVQVELEWPDGRRESRAAVIDVVDVAAESLTVEAIQPSVEAIALDPQATNEQTMDYYFGESIADVTLRGGSWYTSVERDVTFDATVTPAELGGLVEWRIDGEPVALGSRFEHWGFDAPGRHVIEAGAPDRTLAAELGVYSVTVEMTSHPGGGIPADGEVVTFAATTRPAGLEENVRWLSSTRFGTGTPVLGTGSTFSVVFRQSTGLDETTGEVYRWVGVKGDSAALGGDARASVDSASVCGDSIRTTLSPPEASGNFRLTLSGPGGNATIVDTTRSGGTYTDNFNFAGLPRDREFTTVTATWSIDNGTVSDAATAHFSVLGDFRHTQYNCPSDTSGSCSGAPEDVCLTDAACNYSEGTLPSTFVDQVSNPAFGTGCGQTAAYGDIQVEAFCLSRFPPPPECAGDTVFRANTTITPACGGGGLGDNTVAASPGNLGGRLPCGSQVCISPGPGSSVKTVSDRCPACAADQLDNFSTAGTCGILDFCASCLTLKLF